MHAGRWSHILHENESNSERDGLYDVRLRILEMVVEIRQAHGKKTVVVLHDIYLCSSTTSLLPSLTSVQGPMRQEFEYLIRALLHLI
jgi:hypothetical protein